MSVSIHTCPECEGLLLGDSAACPHCGLVLDPKKAEQVPQPLGTALLKGGDEPEKACPLCGEKVRAGLVRCWQCGTFMNPEIESHYQKMQSTQSPVIYSLDPDELMKRSPAGEPLSEDDFELKYDLLREADEVEAEHFQEEMVESHADSVESTGEEDDFTLGATSMMFIPTYEEPAATIPESEYDATQSTILQYDLPPQEDEETPPDWVNESGGEQAGTQAAALEVPEGWDAEQYYQYLRDAMAWFEQLDDDQKGEYAASVTEQTGLPFPPENVHLLYGTPDPAEAETAPAQNETPVEGANENGGEQGADGNAAPRASGAAEGEEHHSIATGGDVLLNAALAEQADLSRRPKGTRTIDPAKVAPGSFIVHCPMGHRIQVKEKHRGQTGKCPVCKSFFHVPAAPAVDPAIAAAQAAEEANRIAMEAMAPGGYELWLQDVHLHLVQTTKLKLKPGSLQGDYETVDLGFGPEGLLVATVFKGSGSFRASQEKKKKPENRTALKDHLRSGKPLSECPLPRTTLIALSDLAQIRVVQPADPQEESIFADVPVFGAGMIAVRIPAAAEGGFKQYLSMTLSEFREFSRLLSETYELPHLGDGLGIPMEDQFENVRCGLSDTIVKHLAGPLEYYKADPKRPLVPVAWKCAGCGIYISEAGAKKEKLGGKNAAGVAKAKCPKCKKKIGAETLMAFPPEPAEAAK